MCRLTLLGLPPLARRFIAWIIALSLETVQNRVLKSTDLDGLDTARGGTGKTYFATTINVGFTPSEGRFLGVCFLTLTSETREPA